MHFNTQWNNYVNNTDSLALAPKTAVILNDWACDALVESHTCDTCAPDIDAKKRKKKRLPILLLVRPKAWQE